MRTFDPDLLRTLVAFADTGTLAKAATVVGRSPSAVTAQMQRLEDAVGIPLLEAVGRRRTLTEAGERFVGHARRILAAQNEAWLSVSGAIADGRIGIGMTQDFADTELAAHLNTFARSHPRVRVDLRVGRTVDLSDDLTDGSIDLLVAMRTAVAPDEVKVIREPMHWLCAENGLVGQDHELPVALLDPPCTFREAALKALETNNKRYRIAATSQSLAGLWTAVRAGIAVTVRTSRSIAEGITRAPSHLKLPKLPEAEFCIRLREDAEDPAHRLAEVLAHGLHRERHS